MKNLQSWRLADAAPDLEMILTRGTRSPCVFDVSELRRATVQVTMRDGIRLATDLYLPPRSRAPVIAMRTAYGRQRYAETFIAFARGGYIAISQDCRGTGDSEPGNWDFGIYEPEDSFDFVDWVTKQDWFDGLLGACGGSYDGSTQWEMARHPRMSAIAPNVAGLISAPLTAQLYNYLNAYSRCVGKGADKTKISYQEMERQMVDETLAGGYFNEPLHVMFNDRLQDRYPELRTMPLSDAKRWLWQRYNTLSPAERAELIKLALGEDSVTFASMERLATVFGHHVCHGIATASSPDVSECASSLRAPALMVTGWYDWGLGDTLASWELLTNVAPWPVASRSRLIITPSAHGVPGYCEGREGHSELMRDYRTSNIVDLILRWYDVTRDGMVDSWPIVTYYLMGANEWNIASAWPPPEVKVRALHLGADGTLRSAPPLQASNPDSYTYDPFDPTPTVGGSILSSVYPAGSIDVSEVQRRPDVLTYTSAPLDHSLDIVGPVRLILYASSTALDTDFSARLTDVFPDGRAIYLQSGILRARYRDLRGDPQLLEPRRVYRLEIDMWATANRFKAGHSVRLDISSADFPKFNRNTNRGGETGPPIRALQTIYHDPQYPSHLLVSVLNDPTVQDRVSR